MEGETMDEFAGAVHNRCSTKLAMATFKWVARSHMVHAGTPVIICDRDSVYKGSRGTVVQTLPVSAKYIVRVDQLADAGERNYIDVKMNRSQFKRAGLCLSETVNPDEEAMETVNASLEFVNEARQELERLRAGHQSGVNEGFNVDCDENNLYTGDIVIIQDGSQFQGWNGQVKFVGPGESIIVTVGMPPGYSARTAEKYEDVRRNRRPGTEHKLSGRDCLIQNLY